MTSAPAMDYKQCKKPCGYKEFRFDVTRNGM